MMIKPVKCCTRNVLLGLFITAVAIVIIWQFVELSRQNVSFANSFKDETVQPSSIVPTVAEVKEDIKEPFSNKCSSNRTFKVASNSASASKAQLGEFHWCSADSSARGAHQKVITYSLFGTGTKENVTVSSRFDSLLKNISMTAAKVYPGWIVRIYHNFRNQSKSGNVFFKKLCDLQCQFDHVDLCDVPEMADNIKSLTPIDPALLRGLNGRMFRYLVMLDPNVDIFISRDIDSVIWQREVDAVDQWLRSNFTFHVMRDHKFHSATVLAGMWGVKLDQRRDLVEGLTRAMILAGQNQDKSTDQNLLDKIVWPSAQYDVMAHDSYHCKNGNLNKKSPIKVIPFPTKRNGHTFVGGVGAKLSTTKCPGACRPPDHKDWEYC